MILFCLLLIIHTITGCATAGRSADQAKVSAIKVGETTEAELTRMFGPPSGRGLDSQGRRMLTWDDLQVQSNSKAYIPVAGSFMKSGDVTQQMLKVSLDEKGLVAATSIQEEKRQTNVFDSNQ